MKTGEQNIFTERIAERRTNISRPYYLYIVSANEVKHNENISSQNKKR